MKLKSPQIDAAPGLPPRFLTLEEVATATRISPRTLAGLLGSGSGPIVTAIGKRRFVRADHLCEWIEAAAQPRRQRKPAA